MNKQQLASKIWESANKMRSKIEANEYKDYILGFIFYKYLSDQEVEFLKRNKWSDEDIAELSEIDDSNSKEQNDDIQEDIEFIQKNIGYYISHKNLFSTWIDKKQDFNVADVRDALSAFNRRIYGTHKKVFVGIFKTLETGLSKLGDSAGSQTKAISSLIGLIKDIPMNGKQDYDVLGFIYEYLIGMFAANAGKKAGEFYTPHEVSLLMSEIVAGHLRDKTEISIYDPTSGSGSLLINIGQSASKYIKNKNYVKYYAQELKENTYNLTRMNLVMRGIKPANIITRNADTLEDDWPYFDENDPAKTYKPLYVDAVVSNPPYSQPWEPSNKENDPRYKNFGLAPKSKADYAFLLHDLYHIKPDGIMTIVLPHGVLFRGGEEGEIRKNLIENNRIDTIIGLPSNIFFGTGIPTIIMVLKQKRTNEDVLIIDASKGFVKDGKNNKLQASDIKKIVDTVFQRNDVFRYSKVVSRDEIRSNDYNLNIPRYVNSSDDAETWDIYASMFGGIPLYEIDKLSQYWSAFTNLREDLFENINNSYAKIKVENIKNAVLKHSDSTGYLKIFSDSFCNFEEYLNKALLENIQEIDTAQEETNIANEIFRRLQNIALVDKYATYQILDDEWIKIAVDLEILQTEGFDAVRKVDPNMVIRKKDGKEHEVQDGWIGRIIPFELVQKSILKSEYDSLLEKESKLEEISSSLIGLIDIMSEDDKSTDLLNDTNTAFSTKQVNARLKDIYQDIINDEIEILLEYLELSKKDKPKHIENHPQINWSKMQQSKDGSFSKTAINSYVEEIRQETIFEEDSLEDILQKANTLLCDEKVLKAQIKKEFQELHVKTKEVIEGLDDQMANILLGEKWIKPLVKAINNTPNTIIERLASSAIKLSQKYENTYMQIESQIKQSQNELSNMLDLLDGDEFEMKGLEQFKQLLLDN